MHYLTENQSPTLHIDGLAVHITATGKTTELEKLTATQLKKIEFFFMGLSIFSLGNRFSTFSSVHIAWFKQLQKTVNSVFVFLPPLLRLVKNQKGRTKCSSSNLLYHFIVFHFLGPCLTVICLHGKLQKLEDKQAPDPDFATKTPIQ